MLFEDNFDFFDANKWQYQLYDGWQYGVGDWGTGELTFYRNSSNNVYINDGQLILNARVESDPSVLWNECWDECRIRCTNMGYAPGSQELQWCIDPCGWPRCDQVRTRGISSGRIRTFNHFSVAPSDGPNKVRIEARIKLPPGGFAGAWPALWTLPAEGATDNCSGCSYRGPWPNGGELDILETANTFDSILGTIHYGGDGQDVYKSFRYNVTTPPPPDGYHVVAVEWSTTSIEWFMDGQLYGTAVPKSATTDGWWTTAGGGLGAPFDGKFYLILNLAVGGWFTGGEYARVNNGAQLDLMTIQNQLGMAGKAMAVDWVRVCGQ